MLPRLPVVEFARNHTEKVLAKVMAIEIVSARTKATRTTQPLPERQNTGGFVMHTAVCDACFQNQLVQKVHHTATSVYDRRNPRATKSARSTTENKSSALLRVLLVCRTLARFVAD